MASNMATGHSFAPHARCQRCGTWSAGIQLLRPGKHPRTVCIRKCLPALLRRMAISPADLSDEIIRRIFVDVVFDSILEKIPGPKLRKTVSVLKQVHFDIDLGAEKLGMKRQAVRIALYRFRKAAEQISQDPALQWMFEEFIC